MINISVGIVKKDNKYLIAKRKLTERTYPGKWEFPGGKVETTESAYEALVREMREEVGLKIDYAQVKFIWGGSHLGFEDCNISFWLIEMLYGYPQLKVHDAIAYETFDQINNRNDLCNPLMLEILELIENKRRSDV